MNVWVTIILVLALCAGMYVVVISALAVLLHLINPPASQAELNRLILGRVLDLRAARLGGIA